MNLSNWFHDRRLVAAVLLCTWLATRAGAIDSASPDGTDVELYFKYAVRGVDFHEVPYRDFEIEYPPVAYWFMVLPRLVDRVPVAPEDLDKVHASAGFNRYGDLYEAQTLVCDAVAFVLFLLLAARRWPQRVLAVGMIYLGVTTFLWPLLFMRLDIGLTTLLMAWAYLWSKSTDDTPRAGAYRVLSYAALGLSISFKIVPLIAIPFLILSELRASRPWRHAAQGLLALAATIVVPFAIHWPTAGAASLKLFEYHGQRGIQVESLYAVLLAIFRPDGWPLAIEHSFGSFNITTAWTPLLRSCSTILLFAFLAGLGLWSLLQGRRYTRERALGVSCLVLTGSVIFAKVLSPQYFVWALPLALLLAAEVLPNQRQTWLLMAAGLLLVARLTTWIYPHNYGELLHSDLVPWAVLAVRNLLYLGVIARFGSRLLLAGQASAQAAALSTRADRRRETAQRAAAGRRTVGVGVAVVDGTGRAA
jgi:hypothetical protein